VVPYFSIIFISSITAMSQEKGSLDRTRKNSKKVFFKVGLLAC